MKIATGNPVRVFGEFGVDGGAVIVTVAAKRGTVRRVAKLWKMLDTADGLEQAQIITSLRRLEAITNDTQVSAR